MSFNDLGCYLSHIVNDIEQLKSVADYYDFVVRTFSSIFASEVTTLWRCTNLFIIIVIIIF